MTRGDSSRGDTPPENEDGHQNAVRHSHDEEARERLPRQLGDGRDGAEEGVLAPREAGVFAKPEGRGVAQHALVENLEEVHPYQDGQDDFVGFPPDALVLSCRVSACA